MTSTFQLTSYQCSQCSSLIFNENNITGNQRNHYQVNLHTVQNLTKEGFSFNCAKCQQHIGDEFSDTDILIRKDRVKECVPNVVSLVDSSSHSPNETDVAQLRLAVRQLQNEQDEMKSAIIMMKESFENQLLDIKRSILQLASEVNKVSQ